MLLGAEEMACAHCRTPREEAPSAESLEHAEKEALRAKRRRRLVAAAVVAALAGGAWLARGRLAASWQEFADEVERTRQPGHWKKAPEPEALAAAPSPPPAVAVSSFVYLNPGSPPPQEAPAEPAPAPPPVMLTAAPFVVAYSTDVEAPESPLQVRVHGTVYDLATALPVPGVKIQFFQQQNNWSLDATTDASGRYQLDLFKSVTEAGTFMIEAPGYRKGLLEDRDPPYRERSARARAELIEETVESDLEPVPLRFRPGERLVALDFVVVPLAKQ